MCRSVSVRTYGGVEEEIEGDMVGEETGAFSKKTGRKKRKVGAFRKKVHYFYSGSLYFFKAKYFFRKTFDYSKLDPYFCA